MPSIRDVMTSNVETLHPNATAQEAASVMLRVDVGAIPVVEDDRVVGMVTDRDIAVRGVAQGRGCDTAVRDLMSDEIVTASVDDNIDSVAQRMSEEQVRRMPVVDGEERLVGIVSLADVSRSDGGRAAIVALGGISETGGQHNQSDGNQGQQSRPM